MKLKKKKSSVRVILEGGTGNQLFMYFAGLATSISLNTDLTLETKYIGKFGSNHGTFLNQLNLQAKIVESSNSSRLEIFSYRVLKASARRSNLVRIFTQKFLGIYQASEIGFDPRVFELHGKVKLHGYFQTWKYFDICQKALGTKLDIIEPSDIYQKCMEAIEEFPTVVVHVRRGDYSPLSNSFGMLSEAYYVQAVRKMFKLYGKKRIWVFSDDIASVQAAFVDDIWLNAEFTNFELNPIETIFLMSKAHSRIISNSTFSYWAALLSQSTERTIAPTPWFRNLESPKDLLPPEWHTIESAWLT